MRIPALKLLAIACAEITDAELLAQFAAHRDEAAFDQLVRRHGPAVLRVCRRLVGSAAAEDAFQAVFLVLACRARQVRKAASVGSWLLGVAGRVARQMRKQSLRRMAASLEGQHDIPDPSQPSPDSKLSIAELATSLDEELSQLHDRLRAPVVLCLIECRTREQAAAKLGWSHRTLRRRLDQAKKLLRLRLERRGLVPTVAAALVSGMQTTSAVPPDLASRTVRGVIEFLAGGPASRATPAFIAKGVVSNMSTFKATYLVPIAACALIGLGVVSAQDGTKNKTVQPLPTKDAAPSAPVWQETQTTGSVKIVGAGSSVGPTETKMVWRSKNFVVDAQTPTMARAIAAEAEYQRVEMAKKWLGKELPAWEKPCRIEHDRTIPRGLLPEFRMTEAVK